MKFTQEQLERFRSAANEVSAALDGRGNLTRSATLLVSLVNVLILPSHENYPFKDEPRPPKRIPLHPDYI